MGTKKTKNKNQQKRDKQIRPKSWFGFLLRNSIAFLIVFLLGKSLYDSQRGYTWMWGSLIKGNVESIKGSYKDFDLDKRHEAKQGFLATYLNYVKNNLPEDAIILMPPDSVIMSVDEKYRLEKLRNKFYTTYFIYPRQVVYEKREQDAPLLDKVTHIAIINGWGYHQLPYNVRQKQQFIVLPLNPNK